MVLSHSDRQLLKTLKQRSRFHLTAFKVKRKHQRPGPFTEEQIVLYTALVDLERSAGLLLETTSQKGPGKNG